MKRSFAPSIAFALVLVAAFLIPERSFAGPVFGCTQAASVCNGNLYAVTGTHIGGNTYQLELDVQVKSGYTGNQWTDVVGSVALKDFASSFSNFSLISAPNGVGSWALNQHELTADGCTGGNGSQNEMCADEKGPYAGAALTGAGQVLSWVFQFDTTTGLNATSHLKYQYEDSSDKKIGDLGSWDIAIQNGTLRVPEPNSAGLVAVALLALLGSAVRLRV